jgi:hypothetical protein
MSTQVFTPPLRPTLAHPRPRARGRLRIEQVVMGGAVAALIVLVVLPLLSLLLGSFKGMEGLSFESFRCRA